METEVEKS